MWADSDRKLLLLSMYWGSLGSMLKEGHFHMAGPCVEGWDSKLASYCMDFTQERKMIVFSGEESTGESLIIRFSSEELLSPPHPRAATHPHGSCAQCS